MSANTNQIISLLNHLPKSCNMSLTELKNNLSAKNVPGLLLHEKIRSDAFTLLLLWLIDSSQPLEKFGLKICESNPDRIEFNSNNIDQHFILEMFNK